MRTLKMRRQGFTLIEILVVIVIIGILATMGIGKYAQFSRDARKSGCQSNQNSIDKGVGMWETKYTPINTRDAAEMSMEFNLLGIKSNFVGNLPGRMKATGTRFESEVFDQIQDEVVFVCPETVTAYGGMDEITQTDKGNLRDYRWIIQPDGYDDTAGRSTGGKKRGTGCLVWGSIASAGSSSRGKSGETVPGGDGTAGPSGTPDDLHSGSVGS